MFTLSCAMNVEMDVQDLVSCSSSACIDVQAQERLWNSLAVLFAVVYITRVLSLVDNGI
jgi:hypothetical protein